jgi:hypothetical protein
MNEVKLIPAEDDFSKTSTIKDSNTLFKFLEKYSGFNWIFQGRGISHRLKSSLERAFENLGISLGYAQAIEWELIRQFRRWYHGDDSHEVQNSLLYCSSLMRHHGAPVRLLDWTYSSYVAVYFGIEEAISNYLTDKGQFAVWCLNTDWCVNEDTWGVDSDTKSNILNLIKKLSSDDMRKEEEGFQELYMKYTLKDDRKKEEPFKLVIPENPWRFHERLNKQQGVFLCPGDILVPFEDNLKAMKGWEKTNSIFKIICHFNIDELHRILNQFIRMNITRATLFPDIDGFSESLQYRLAFTLKLHSERMKKQQDVPQ